MQAKFAPSRRAIRACWAQARPSSLGGGGGGQAHSPLQNPETLGWRRRAHNTLPACVHNSKKVAGRGGGTLRLFLPRRSLGCTHHCQCTFTLQWLGEQHLRERPATPCPGEGSTPAHSRARQRCGRAPRVQRRPYVAVRAALTGGPAHRSAQRLCGTQRSVPIDVRTSSMSAGAGASQLALLKAQAGALRRTIHTCCCVSLVPKGAQCRKEAQAAGWIHSTLRPPPRWPVQLATGSSAAMPSSAVSCCTI